MTDSRVTPQTAVEAVMERLLMTHPSWFKRLSLSRNRDSDEARSAAQTLAEAALAAAVPLLCQPLQDEIDRLTGNIVAALNIIGEDGCYCDDEQNDDCANHRIEAALRAAVPVGTGNPTQPRADD